MNSPSLLTFVLPEPYRQIVFLLIVILVCVSSPLMAADSKTNADDKKLNIVFILADDLGWRDVGCYGSTFYETPAIDKLAQEGMRFTNAYAACPVCSPTRASILTGQYPARLHLTDWLPGRKAGSDNKLKEPVIVKELPSGEVTFADALRNAGYATGFFGKWHLGNSYPDRHGFDLNIGGCGMGHPNSYFSPYRNPTLTDGPKGEYLTDRLTDEAIKFIQKSKDKPFLVYLSHYTVHIPLQPKKDLLEKYEKKHDALPPANGPKLLPEGTHGARQIQNNPNYAAMVESLDQSVKRVMDKLTELGLDKNTVIVFFSDNGGLSTAEGSPTSNVPLRGGKGWTYEGGIREPMIVKWPGVVQPGSTCDEPVISTDLYPTFLKMTGQPPMPQQAKDGVSIVPLLKNEKMPERPLFWHYPHYSDQGGQPSGAVRLGDYKLIEWYEDMHVALFNLKDDIGEKNNLAKQMPDKTKELLELLHNWREAVNADMPTPNPKYKPHITEMAPANSLSMITPSNQLDDDD